MVSFWTIFYALLTAFAVRIAARAVDARGDHDRGLYVAASVLAADYVFSTISDDFLHPHMLFYPVTDSIIGIFFVLRWFKERHAWQMVMIGLFLSDCIQHLSFYQVGDTSYAAVYSYDLALNIIFIAQLLTVTIPSLRILAKNRALPKLRGVVAFILSLAIATPAFATGKPPLLGGAYDTDAQSYFNALAANSCPTPTAAFKQAVSAFFVTEKANGNYYGSPQAMGYILATADSRCAAVNLYQPSLYNVTWAGSPTFTVASGLNGDAATIYGDTNVTLSALTRYSQNSAHLLVCQSSANSSNALGQLNVSAPISMQPITNKATRLNQNATTIDTAGGGAGCHWADRTSSSTISTGLNSTVQSSAASAVSTTLTANDITICRVNANFCPAGNGLFFIEVGQPFTSETNHTAAIRTMLLAIGAVGV